MARPEKIELPVVNTNGADGDARIIDRFRNKSVQFSGVSGGSFNLELEIDGIFVSVQTITADGITEVPQTAESARIHTTTASGGTPSATIMGFDDRVHA